VADPKVRSGSRADRRQKNQGPPTGQERRGLGVPPVKINWQMEPDGILITLANPIVVSNCYAARDRVVGYCDRFTARRLTLDLSGVPYVDTAGVGILMELKARCVQEYKTLIVQNPTSYVRQILEFLHLDGKLLAEG